MEEIVRITLPRWNRAQAAVPALFGCFCDSSELAIHERSLWVWVIAGEAIHGGGDVATQLILRSTRGLQGRGTRWELFPRCPVLWFSPQSVRRCEFTDWECHNRGVFVALLRSKSLLPRAVCRPPAPLQRQDPKRACIKRRANEPCSGMRSAWRLATAVSDASPSRVIAAQVNKCVLLRAPGTRAALAPAAGC